MVYLLIDCPTDADDDNDDVDDDVIIFVVVCLMVRLYTWFYLSVDSSTYWKVVVAMMVV